MQEGNQIEEIKERVDIVQLVEKYVKLKQTGKNFSGLCPFHKEKTPSFIVSPDLQRYKCFGCGRSGDIFNFVQDIENIDFVEALEKLAKIAGVELKKSASNSKYKELKEIHYIATKYYYNQLLKSPSALNYVLKRGISREYIKKFAIGYSPKYPKLISEIKKTGSYSKKVLLETGLFTEKNGELKEKFFDRIMFPIRSRRGDVIAFTARQNAENEYGPKYMNSPETPLFHKSYNLFGQYESRQEIRKQDLVIICEGSTDVISAHQVGIKNIVAPLGTSLTLQQLESLIPLTKNVLLFFDNDTAGRAALIRGFELASKLGMNPFAATPSPYKDIDEFIQNKPEKISEVINNKVEAFSFILANVIKDKDLNKLEDINKIQKIIFPILDTVQDKNTKSLYIRKLEEITGIKYGKVEVGITNRLSPTQVKSSTPYKEDTETRYIQLLLFADKRKDEYFIDSKYISDTLQREIYDYISQNKSVTKSELFEKINNHPNIQQVLEDMIFNANRLPQENEFEKELFSLQRQLKGKYYKEIQKNLVSKIAMSEEIDDDDEKEKALKRLQKVAKILHELKNE